MTSFVRANQLYGIYKLYNPIKTGNARFKTKLLTFLVIGLLIDRFLIVVVFKIFIRLAISDLNFWMVEQCTPPTFGKKAHCQLLGFNV